MGAAGEHPVDAMTAITRLQTALSGHDITGTSVWRTGEGTAMLLAGERIVQCSGGCFWWDTGRFRGGRSVAAFRTATDPAGAASCLARLLTSPQTPGAAG
jgi:hypothetical protein